MQMKIQKLRLGNPQKTLKGLSARNRLHKSHCCTSSVDRAPRDHANVTNKVVVSLSYLATLVEGYIPRRCPGRTGKHFQCASHVSQVHDQRPLQARRLSLGSAPSWEASSWSGGSDLSSAASPFHSQTDPSVIHRVRSPGGRLAGIPK